MPKKDPAKQARAKLELDRLTYRRWDNDDWLKLPAALDLISVARGVDGSQARAYLIEACVSERVQARYVVSLASQDFMYLNKHRPPTWGDLLGDNNAKAYRGIAPATWQRNDGTIDLVTGAYDYDNPDGRYAGEAVIEINAADLAECLKRPRRGPKPGTVSRYAAADRALFPEIKRLLDDGKATSPHDAALQLVEAGKVAGTATPDSKKRRLAGAYIAHYARKTL